MGRCGSRLGVEVWLCGFSYEQALHSFFDLYLKVSYLGCITRLEKTCPASSVKCAACSTLPTASTSWEVPLQMALNEVISLKALKAKALQPPSPLDRRLLSSLKSLGGAQEETINLAVCSCVCVAMYLSCCHPDIDWKCLNCVCLNNLRRLNTAPLQAAACPTPWRLTVGYNMDLITDQTTPRQCGVKARQKW